MVSLLQASKQLVLRNKIMAPNYLYTGRTEYLWEISKTVHSFPACNCVTFKQLSFIFQATVEAEKLTTTDLGSYPIKIYAGSHLLLELNLTISEKGNLYSSILDLVSYNPIPKKVPVKIAVVSTPSASFNQTLSERFNGSNSTKEKPIVIPNFKDDSNSTLNPLTMRYDFKRNGTLFMRMNQEIVVPRDTRHSQNKNNSNPNPQGRSLVAIPEIDKDFQINGTALEFELIMEEHIEDFNWTVELVTWHPWYLQLQFNFSDYVAISQGHQLDRLNVKIIDRSYFVSVFSGQMLDSKFSRVPRTVFIPRQLPPEFNEDRVMMTAGSSSAIIGVVMVCQLGLQALLNGSIYLVTELFLAMQMVVYVYLFNIKMPAIAQIVMSQFKQLIEFHILNPEKLHQKLTDPDFRLAKAIRGIEGEYESQDQQWSVFQEIFVFFFLAMLCLGVILVLILVSLKVSKNTRAEIRKHVQSVKKRVVYNGLILVYKIAAFKICIAIGNQMKLVVYHSPYLSTGEITFASLLLAAYLAFAAHIWNFLTQNESKLKLVKMRRKFGNLYVFAPMNRDKPFLRRMPIFLVHRLAFVLVGSLLHPLPGISLIVLFSANLCYTSYLLEFKMKAEAALLRLNVFTHLIIHLLMLSLCLPTDFATTKDSQIFFSFLYAGLLGAICLAYVCAIIRMNFIYYQRRQRLLAIMKAQGKRPVVNSRNKMIFEKMMMRMADRIEKMQADFQKKMAEKKRASPKFQPYIDFIKKEDQVAEKNENNPVKQPDVAKKIEVKP